MFIHGDEKDKLTILYFIRAIGGDVRPDIICDAMIRTGLMDYFTYQMISLQLEQDGYVAIVPRNHGESYCITGHGTEALSLFAETLPLSLRKKIDDFIRDNHNELLKKAQYSSDLTELRDGSWLVSMRVSERNNLVLEVKLTTVSKELGLTMRSNWERESPAIYSEIMSRLNSRKRVEQEEQTE